MVHGWRVESSVSSQVLCAGGTVGIVYTTPDTCQVPGVSYCCTYDMYSYIRVRRRAACSVQVCDIRARGIKCCCACGIVYRRPRLRTAAVYHERVQSPTRDIRCTYVTSVLLHRVPCMQVKAPGAVRRTCTSTRIAVRDISNRHQVVDSISIVATCEQRVPVARPCTCYRYSYCCNGINMEA